uniref:ATP synthase F0 subunit 6 n=1 Tax=Lamellodiscus spari TaxID=330065 RepID=A0A346Q034_9PLAT|nr:ATP synthase F0 subunit 6 [Lamellodiscus spari]
MILNNWLGYSSLIRTVLGNISVSNWFNLVLCFLLINFLLLRMPTIYGSLGFFVFVFCSIFPLFFGFLYSRLEFSVLEFFSSLIPANTPLWIAPLVGLAETISYIVRPFVLIIRPFLNITIGILGSNALSSFCLNNNILILGLIFLFFYEVFVAVVHWFIVANILLFSRDH